MAKTTEKQPATAKTKLPEYSGLAINVTCPLSAELCAEVDAYHADCISFDKQVAALQRSRAQLLAAAMDTTVRDLISGGASLSQQKSDLEQTLAALHWQRFELLPKLHPAFKKAVADATAHHETTIAAEMERFEAMGAGVCAMPAYQHNQPAARIQFRKGIEQETVCMVALGALQKAQSALQGLEGQLGVVPGLSACSIRWHAAGDVSPLLIQLVGIA